MGPEVELRTGLAAATDELKAGVDIFGVGVELGADELLEGGHDELGGAATGDGGGAG